jgi:hypothetical protein
MFNTSTIRAKELGVILKELEKWSQHWKTPRIITAFIIGETTMIQR